MLSAERHPGEPRTIEALGFASAAAHGIGDRASSHAAEMGTVAGDQGHGGSSLIGRPRSPRRISVKDAVPVVSPGRKSRKQREARSPIRARRKRGRPAFGYTFTTNSPTVIVEAQAQVVRLVFALRADGASTAAIAAVLNARGHQSAMGKSWRYQTVALCLAYPPYRGIAAYDRKEMTNSGRPVVDAGNLRIVDPVTCSRVDAFEAAEKREAAAGRSPGRSKPGLAKPNVRPRMAKHSLTEIPRPKGRVAFQN